jgi:hypothetical protein
MTPNGPVPYSYIQMQVPYTESISSMDYNGLQISSQFRLHSGITGTVAYTWSKTLTTGCDGYNSGCIIQNPYDLQLDRGPAAYDLPQIFSASFVLPLPFGEGKRFNAGNRVLNQIIGGWQLNGIATMNSGPRYSIYTDNSISGTQNYNGVELADLVGDPYASGGGYTVNKLQPINPNAFANPANGTFGDSGRNRFVADWGRNLDLSLFRTFKISDTKRFEFRAEAFNVTNTPVFAGPDPYLTDGPGFFGVVSSSANTERQMQLALKFYF